MNELLMTRKVDELRPHDDQSRVYGGEFDQSLVDSIREFGILDPVVITKGNVIVSGSSRWCVAKHLGLQEVPVTIFPSDDDLAIREALVHFNRQRVKSKRQVAAEAALLIEVEQQRALRRMQATQLAGKDQNGKPRNSGPEPVSGPTDNGDARDKVGKILGVSGPTVDKMLRVDAAIKKAEAENKPELVEKLKETLETRGYKPAAKLAEEGGVEPADAGPQVPECWRGAFQAIVVAPPWARDEQESPMTVKEMRRLPVNELAAAEAVLWLWVDTRHLPDALTLVRAWGFEYADLLTRLEEVLMEATWLSSQTRHCVVAVRDKLTPTLTDHAFYLEGEELKPFYQTVEKVCTGRKAELFARECPDGWVRLEDVAGGLCVSGNGE